MYKYPTGRKPINCKCTKDVYLGDRHIQIEIWGIINVKKLFKDNKEVTLSARG